LTAALESRLNQQQAQAGHSNRHVRLDENAVYERQRLLRRSTSPLSHRLYNGLEPPYERARTRSPPYHRYQTQSQSLRYRGSSPPAGRVVPGHQVRTALGSLDNVRIGRAPHQEHYRAYVENVTRHPPARNSTLFELVRVRDPQGDYYIRRPLRPEPQSEYATYECERRGPRDVVPQFRAYNQEWHRIPAEMEISSRVEMGPRQLRFESHTRQSETRRQEAPYETLARRDASAYEEYDPRFPAGAPGPHAPHQARYE
jgi:hypothetical protein